MKFEMTAKIDLDDERVIVLVIDLIEELLKKEMDCEIIDLPTLDEDYQENLINRCIAYEIGSLFAEPVFNDYLDDIELSFNNDIMGLEEICSYYYDEVLNQLEEMCN